MFTSITQANGRDLCFPEMGVWNDFDVQQSRALTDIYLVL